MPPYVYEYAAAITDRGYGRMVAGSKQNTIIGPITKYYGYYYTVIGPIATVFIGVAFSLCEILVSRMYLPYRHLSQQDVPAV